jgi:hypothetical protein
MCERDLKIFSSLWEQGKPREHTVVKSARLLKQHQMLHFHKALLFYCVRRVFTKFQNMSLLVILGCNTECKTVRN